MFKKTRKHITENKNTKEKRKIKMAQRVTINGHDYTLTDLRKIDNEDLLKILMDIYFSGYDDCLLTN